ncbi:MAG: Rieske (2Fe-2S) protein [Bacteroidota bacterium]|nr:Rieske (2Fe-2S) protein [Bacteroidota bacterium]MDP3147370.1 Rieske (2Fe-2S) protein [Bacteroidota bacterium]
MERRNFIKQCGLLGASCLGLSLLFESCSSTHYIQGIADNNRLQINKSDFILLKNDKTTFRKCIIAKLENSDYPIVVYRFSENNFSALLLRCTHQGNELNVNGDLLTCSAHGSEFSNKGDVIQGPAEQKLKSFPVTTDEKNIYIQLAA